MQIPSELLAVAGVVLVVVLALVIRSMGKKSRPIERPAARGPANLRFTCAGCSGQFTHTKRTIGAWEKGTRRFFCNECHKKWRNSQPPQPAQGEPPTFPSAPSRGSSASTSPAFPQRTKLAKSGAGSGCLGMLVLAIAVPIGIAIVVA